MTQPRSAELVSPLLTPAQAAQILGITTRQLARRRRQNTAPKSFVIGTKLIRFDRAAVERSARHSATLANPLGQGPVIQGREPSPVPTDQ
jgi:predicted DNA-binding transcriptional regulator AlpA